MTKVVEFKEVSKFYGSNLIVENISFTISKNTITSLIGPNGAGKTTVAKLVLGIELPTTGNIIKQNNLSLSYVPQKINLNYNLPITVNEFLYYIAPNWLKNAEEIIDFINFDFTKDKQLISLSGGQMQRVAIAASLLKKASLMVLDEPTQGLDIIGQQQLYTLLTEIKKKRKASILIISHDLHTVMPTSDQVLCINQHICCSNNYQNNRDVTSGSLTTLNSQLGIYTHNHDHTHN